MKKLTITACMALAASLWVACDERQDFIRDNVEPTGVGSIPISNNTLQDVTATPLKTLGTTVAGATVYPAGSSFKTELTYFSESPIKEINLYTTVGAGTRTLTTTIPYAPAFSTNKKLDTMLVPYTVPAAATGTVVKLEYQILNENSLNAIRTTYVKLQ
jgi:hypothetical protein